MAKLNNYEPAAFTGLSHKTTIGAAVAAAVGAGPGAALAQESQGIEEICKWFWGEISFAARKNRA